MNTLFSEVSDETAVGETVAEEVTAVAEEETTEEATEAAPEDEGFKIYVGNLSYEFEQEQIIELFSPYGEIKESFVPTDKFSGKPRGFAFITMTDREAGEKAVEALNDTEVGGRTIKVNEQLSKEQLQDRQQKKGGRKEFDGTKIYVGNLPFDAEEDEISSMFSQYGTVNDCFLPVDRDTGRPRGFAFITMAEAEALNAIESLNETEFGGRQLVVNKSLPKGESAPPRAKRVKLYVGNLSFATEEDEVLSLFSEYGDVIDCYMPRDRETGRPRGFAFVTMNEEDAMAAEADCDGFEMDGRNLRVNQAQPKGSGGGGGGGYSNNNSYDSYGSEEGFYDNGGGSTWGSGY